MSIFSLRQQAQPVVEVKIWGTKPNLFLDAKVNRKTIMRMKCILQEKSILIGDIVPIPAWSTHRVNKGYGSALMKELIAYAEANHFDFIKGNLATVDLDHKDRLHHFYTKFGFFIIEYAYPKESYYGEITKLIENYPSE